MGAACTIGGVIRRPFLALAFALIPLSFACNASFDDTCRDGTCTTVAVTGEGNLMGAECNGLRCDVATVLRDNCQTCHGDPLSGNAPMPLLNYNDTQIYLYPSDQGVKPVWVRMRRAIQVDAAPPQMPFDDHPMAKSAIDTLNSWFDTCGGAGGAGGAAAGGAAPVGKCEMGPGDPNGGHGGGGGASGAGGATTSAGGAGAGGKGGAGGIGGAGGPG